MIILKVCNKCHEQLPLTEFYNQGSTKDGKQYTCKKCTNNKYKGYYEENKGNIIEKKRDWQMNNKDKHCDHVTKYAKSPTGRLNRAMNNLLTKLLGVQRESFFHLIGTSASALLTYFVDKLPKDSELGGYNKTWVIGFIDQPTLEELKSDPRRYLNWKNLTPIDKINKKRDLILKESDNETN